MDRSESTAAGGVERLILVDPQDDLCAAWRHAFGTRVDVEIVRGRFEELSTYDCVVSPANSFGLMDGGMDLAIRERFPGVESRVQEAIATAFRGYQPVGTSLLVPSGDDAHPWVAHTPTMSLPMTLIGDRRSQIYSAMWAMLCAVAGHNQTSPDPIRVVACPGLGTFHGRVPAPTAAALMALAYATFSRPPSPPSWRAARAYVGRLAAAADPRTH